MKSRLRIVAALTAAMFVSMGLAEAGQRHQGGGGSAAVGRAVPRGGDSGGRSPGGGRPGGGNPPYRGGGYYRPSYRYNYGYPYYGYPYYGYPFYGYPYYGYSPWGWGLSLGYGWGYPYGYGYWGSPYGPYGYGSTYAYPSNYGGVRIQGAPKDAEVYADGYYVGIVDDFDGALQRLNLESGPHHIEVTRPGEPNAVVDVNIHPGQTVIFRVN